MPRFFPHGFSCRQFNINSVWHARRIFLRPVQSLKDNYTVSGHHRYCESEDNGLSILQSSPKPASLSDSAFNNLHTFLLLSVYAAMCGGALISFWQQMPAGHFFGCIRENVKDFYMMKRMACSCLFKTSEVSALPTFIRKLKHVFSCHYSLLVVLIVPLTFLIAQFAAGFKSMLLYNCRYHANKYGEQNRTNK